MTDLRELSELPEDDAYWQALETRIMAELGPRVRASADRPVEWWAPIARRAWGLGGLAAAAGLVALLVAPARGEHGLSTPLGLLHLTTDDARLAPFLASPAPPPITSLVLPPDGRTRE